MTERPHTFDESLYCVRCGLPAEWLADKHPVWRDCFLPTPSPERWKIIRSGVWRKDLWFADLRRGL
jgi:hypothetical protein